MKIYLLAMLLYHEKQYKEYNNYLFQQEFDAFSHCA
jgi:hypothetical protein